MKNLYICFLLLYVAATGSAEGECTAVDETTLKCQFPDNINLTKQDFQVIFYPFTGVEAPVVDCTWIKSQLHCITQMGFQRVGPVSNTAVITIPTRLSDINGNYRCVVVGYPYDSMKNCRFADRGDIQHFSACEAKLASGRYQVILECRFSLNTDSFSVEYNSSISFKLTKSSCQNSTFCNYKVDNNHHMFTMELGLPEYLYGEYLCHPDDLPSLFEVKGCTLAIEKLPGVTEQHRGSSIPLWALIFSFTFLVLLSVLVLVLLIMRKKVRQYFQRTSAVSLRNICCEYQLTTHAGDMSP